MHCRGIVLSMMSIQSTRGNRPFPLLLIEIEYRATNGTIYETEGEATGSSAYDVKPLIRVLD